MGEAIPLNVAQQPLTPSVASVQPLPVQTLPVTLQSAPASFPAVTRPIQITGTIVNVQQDGTLSLRTAAGVLSLAVQTTSNPVIEATATGNVPQTPLIKLITALQTNPQPVTLSLQPGPNASVQAALLLPEPNSEPTATQIPAATSLTQQPAALPETPVISTPVASVPLSQPALQGQTVTVTVLPDLLEQNLLTAFQQSPTTQETAVPAQAISYFAKQDPVWMAQQASQQVGTLWNPEPTQEPQPALIAQPVTNITHPTGQAAPAQPDTVTDLPQTQSSQAFQQPLTAQPAVTVQNPIVQEATQPSLPTQQPTTLPQEQAVAQQTTALPISTPEQQPALTLPSITIPPQITTPDLPPSQQSVAVQAPPVGATKASPDPSVFQSQKTPLLQQSAPPLEVGHDVKVRIEAVFTAQTSWPTTPKDTPQIQATVVGLSPSGRMILHAENKTLFVQQIENSPLPPGTKLLLAPEQDRPGPSSPTLFDTSLPAMRELVEALTQTNVAAAQNFIQGRLPNPMQNLSGTMLFFLSALNKGKLEEWLGPQTKNLLDDQHKSGLISKALSELDDQNGTVHDTHTGEWKAWTIPLHYGQAFEKISLYVRDGGGRSEQEEKKGAAVKRTRFLVSMNMTRLGAMQMEGLSQAKQLDLVIRSEKPLPQKLPEEIRTTYLGTLEALGLVGSIMFQSDRRGWIDILPDQTTAEPFLA